MDIADGQWTPQPVTDGEWAGWMLWSPDPFELLAGPFYVRRGDGGVMTCAFRAERKHMNGHGAMHGGCLMTFADYAIFCFASEHLQDSGSVTAQMNCDFVDAAFEGDLVECTGEVVRAGASLIFIRGQITAAGRVALTFSAILKKTKKR
ncbi:MAG: PaaI family thioesterase [Caulobacteraceae bacterium]